MKTAIGYRNISELARPGLKGLIGNLLDRHLQPHLSHFPAELIRLRATLERSGHRSLYRARLRLGLPSTTLTCSDASHDLGKALVLAFAELEDQLERHIVHLRHEDNWRRKERRAGLRRLKGAVAGPAGAGPALFSELVRPLLPEFNQDDDAILFEYWQPDEMLRLEDVMPAAGGTPEEALSVKETRRFVTALIAEMPTLWRVPQASAARVLGTSERELECWLAEADAFLKARLGELRFAPRDADVAGDYIETGTPPPAPRLTREFDDAMRGNARASGSA
ncbi:RNA polymerase subunit sigma-28 [Burkholderia sp. Bp9126]|nr:RNA polymerase subunit sigma-28 [Burkholderia sp. Bp9126]